MDNDLMPAIKQQEVASSSNVKKRINVVEESTEPETESIPAEPEAVPVPEKPLVTPLTIDQTQPKAPTLSESDDTVIEEPKLPAEPQPAPQPTPTPDKESNTSAAPAGSPQAWQRHEDKVQYLPIGGIKINPLQPRREFDPIEMDELARSIQYHGILQPLVVRRTADGFELISGERRLRAAKSIGWDKVPCVVRNDVGSDRSRLELALIENIQRKDLNPIEEAMAFKQLTDEYGMSHEEIGQRVGMSRVAVTNTVRMLQLPDDIQIGLAEGKITSGHARAILMIPDGEKQSRFYRHLVEEGLTVRKAELRARRIQRVLKVSDPLRIKLKGKLAQALKYNGPLEDTYGFGANIRFMETKNRFEVVFTAHSEPELEELCDRLLKGKKKLKDKSLE